MTAPKNAASLASVAPPPFLRPIVAGLHYQVPGVDQTTFADDGLGNCLQAVVATILGEPLDEVPDFLLYGPKWLAALDLYLSIWALTIERVHDDPYGVAIAVGPSPRNVKHAVLCVNGDVVHDPHLSRAGLVSVDYWLALWGDVYCTPKNPPSQVQP